MQSLSAAWKTYALDYAQQMKYLVDERDPKAIKITVIQDQLNTHVPASLYKAFDPAEAKRILDKLEFHYTPKHGSWLNMAEIEREGRWGFPSLSNHAVEFSVLARQCLERRIPDQETLKQEVAAWEANRNPGNHSVDWRFTSADARIKLKRLYPSIQTW
jgi:hypothetical protein